MFCPRCGVRVEEGNKFCQSCGQEVGAEVAVAAGAAVAIPSPAAPAGRVASALPYAGFWERFAAYLIDGIILGIPFGILVLVLISMFGGIGMILHRSQVPLDPNAAAAFVAPMMMVLFGGMFVFIIFQWLYFAGMESSERQATLGKSVMSLRVANVEGQPLSFGHATGRFFAKIVSGMVPFAIGYIMAAFTARKQALHDLIAGTLVLKK